MLKRELKPSLADIAMEDEIKFSKNDKVDVRAHLTTQKDEGINLLFYDWTNSFKANQSGSRPSASGKRKT